MAHIPALQSSCGYFRMELQAKRVPAYRESLICVGTCSGKMMRTGRQVKRVAMPVQHPQIATQQRSELRIERSIAPCIKRPPANLLALRPRMH